MKVIIDIDEDRYKWIKEHKGVTDFQTTQSIYESIINAVIFGNIISEIEEKAKEHIKYTDYGRRENGLYEALEIIDNYISELKGEQNESLEV